MSYPIMNLDAFRIFIGHGGSQKKSSADPATPKLHGPDLALPPRALPRMLRA
ncbi:hypothetical protein HEQ62_10520 [Haematospirillum jordaniae]|uniref:hypothetical protein n=1 Tax=Haematospirillum jordaniae TaxID=1549855 RepID=UPI001432A9FC|nr:hypothetical protein [Haematospirillum jordaniae]NKD46034.1 hypothetical protein [Haematospirillum jordaniae]NKD60203.1 hypothetical protein [Haematospirillum jordaniae]NKD68093.1 hypothetical protein [Haematospirillum jordaniae]NKD79594.1 hypothetical protein [Haematospirillum jordaniae]NKD82266.1 hypothetical protein [Haematospirillum jordaniae]